MTNNGQVAKIPLGAGPDDLSGDVSISAQLDASGLTLKAHSRAVAACDLLVGGAVGILGSKVDGIRARTALSSRHKTSLLAAKQAGELAKVEAANKIEQITLDRLIAEEVRKQENREAVCLAAVETLKLSASAPDASGLEAEGEAEEPTTLDQDWMNYFISHAEKATTEKVRQVWGQILAGEIGKPGSFSVGTMRVLSELDSGLSALFQRYAEMRVAADQLLSPENLEGITLIELTSLEDAGLVQSSSNPLAMHKNITTQTPLVSIEVGAYCLRCFDVPTMNLHWRVILLTRAGKQIAAILPWNQEVAARDLAGRLDGDFSIELARIVGRHPGGFDSVPVEILRTEPPT